MSYELVFASQAEGATLPQTDMIQVRVCSRQHQLSVTRLLSQSPFPEVTAYQPITRRKELISTSIHQQRQAFRVL
ncbi:uncharacterized protein BO96DRAFT_17298 [Aspergillus niger CBS 101883]|uniref:uncharacterized protein n=1 Tax=Aspergillus lacticoffeatus (strain CBS 101883) TaxID=1450533 RepID=UPI000D7FE4D5|nr:uncharacterized protein BO96DRAFT_17298 [Aspergillus niger CBS 101883]PYH62614.1 hypothetical protein BO96DRAFT_17298 [Aspergillus niger CBS 101883]